MNFDAKKLRHKAILHHDRTVSYFCNEYKKMEEDYFQSAFTYGRKKIDELLDNALMTLPEGSRILDIGCGTGEQIKRCRLKGFNITGIEPSSEMRHIARTLNPGIEIMDGTIDNLPFQDDSFDFIMAIEVLRYLHPLDIQQAYSEILRVLKPGGMFFFTMVNRYALDGFYIYETIKRFIYRFLKYDEPAHCEFVTPGQVRIDLEKLGIKDITFYGRMLGLLRVMYKISETVGTCFAKNLESFDNLISKKRWTIPFAGHLIVIAKRPSVSAISQ